MLCIRLSVKDGATRVRYNDATSNLALSTWLGTQKILKLMYLVTKNKC